MTDPLTDEQLAEIRARAYAATLGPWWSGSLNSCRWLRVSPQPIHPEVDGSGEDYYGCHLPWDNADADGDFIAHARTDIPALVAEIDRLRSWKGLLSILDELYPDDIPIVSQPEHGPGPHLVWALRQIDRLRRLRSELETIREEACEYIFDGADLPADWWTPALIAIRAWRAKAEGYCELCFRSDCICEGVTDG